MRFTEFILDKMKLKSTSDMEEETLYDGRKQNRVLHFFFPIPSVVVLLLFFVFAILVFEPQDVLLTTLVFFVICVLPLDCLIWMVRFVIKKIRGVVDSHTSRTLPDEYDAAPKEPPITIDTTRSEDKSCKNSKKQFSKEYIDMYADMCSAHCEFDESQNFHTTGLDGNFRFNDKRFYNVTDDDFIKNFINVESVNRTKKLIVDAYSAFGIGIIIEDVNFTRAYAIFHIVPCSGVRLYKILELEREISAALREPVIINAIFDKGYVGLMIPIGHLIDNPNYLDSFEMK